MATQDAGMREALRAGEEELKVLRAARAGDAGEALADRSRPGAQAGRAEVPRRDQPQGTELPGGGTGSGATSRCPMATPSPKPSSRANEVRGRIEALGPVNAAAMEEYQEAQQRHDFLSAQRQDLIDSIRDTEKAIQEIDQVSRQKFAEAFEAINANFRVGFQTLFGGGTGEMRLTDQENIADSGIDIVCSPPGKRLQNVLLLSGGEKALAAVALLMAIFRYQPSPFCMMDEVDAPLDEANIGRLDAAAQGDVASRRSSS